MTAVLPRARIPFTRVEISAGARLAVDRVLESGWVTTGREVVAFEEEFAESVSAEHAVAVSSCTAALELALRGLGLHPGAKVLLPAMTFCSAAHAIIHAGYRPVLCDLSVDTLAPTPATVAAAVDAVAGVDAMMVLHFAGAPSPVAELAAAAGLPTERVVEDAAHAVGTWLDDAHPVGTASAAAAFSFYATKNLPIGEGGMLTTDDDDLAEFARRARLHGMNRDAWARYAPGASWRYSVDGDGLKANMTDVQAAIGRAQLIELPGWQMRREQLARRYDELLASVPGLVRPAWPETGRHAWHLYVVRVTPEFGITRDELIGRLSEVGVDCSVHFIPLHHFAYFAPTLGAGDLPATDAVARQVVSLPMYPTLRDGEIERICTAIEDARVGHPAVVGTAGSGVR
jgi:dTDP-4-amino-4,6-dideoxygalactose transaminase